MESLLKQITMYLVSQSWQIALLTLFITLISFLMKNRSAHIRYLLWMIVLAKCIVPPFHNIQLAVLPEKENTQVSYSEPTNENIFNYYTLPEVIPSEAPLPIPAAPELIQTKVESQPITAANKTNIDTRYLLAIIWLAGTFVFAFYYLFNALRTELWLRNNRKELPPQYKEDIKKTFKSYGVKKMPHIWSLEKINQPFVWGLIRGSIYLPAEMINKKQMKSNTSLIGHEISHVIRFDALINSLQVIAQTAFWFHPFVWWTNRKIRIEREKCCDEMTIARLNAVPEDYSNAIVDILAAKYERTNRIPSLAIAGNIKNIEERIKIMLTPGKKFYKRAGILAIMSILLIAAITVPTAFVLTSCTNKNIASDNGNEELLKILNIPFQFDSPITISLGENTFSNPKISNNPTIKFYKENDKAFADFDITYSSYPKTTWQVGLDLIDSNGDIFKNIQAKFENSGWIAKYPFVENKQVKIDCGRWDDIKNTEAFALDLESIKSTYNNVIKYDEEIPLSLELDGLDSSFIIKLNQAEFTKINDSQAISLKLNTFISSWPKAKCKITCNLLDEDGNLFGQSDKIIENNGIIFGLPGIRIEDISILIQNNAHADFSDVKRYEITLEKIIDNEHKYEIESASIKSGPVTRTFASDDIQKQGIDILRKMAEINRYWLSGPAEGVNNYSYVFSLGDKEPKNIEVDNSNNTNSPFRQGITYFSVLHQLASDSESATITSIQEEDNIIRLDYTLKESMKIALGNGISGTWHGFFSSGVDSGTLWLDAEKLVPIKSISRQVEENYSNYVAIGESQYVPLSININKDIMHFNWTFKLYEPGLWLFDNANYKLREGDWEQVASISNLQINMEPAVSNHTSPVTISQTNESINVNSISNNIHEPNITYTTQNDRKKIDDIIRANQTWLLPSLEDRKGLVYQYSQEEPYLETIMFDENGNIMSQLQSCKESPNEPSNQLLYQADGTYIRTKFNETFVRPQKIDIDENNWEKSLIKKDRTVKNLATGLNLDCALTKLARNPEIFKAKIETLDNNTYKLTLNTSNRDARIFTGTMLTFTSWAYMHDISYSKSEIIFDSETNMPISEKDYNSSRNLVASYTFSDYLDSPAGMAPGKINALIPYEKDGQDNSLEMEAVFDFVRPDIWLLKTCHSEFKNGASSSTGAVKVLPVTQNSFEPIEQLLERIENTNQIFSNLNNAKEGKVVATMQPGKRVPVFAKALWSEKAQSYITDLKNATGYDKPLIGVVEANCQNLDSGAIRFSFTLFSNLYWKEFLTIVSYEIFNTSGESFRADIPVTIRTEESPKTTVTTLEIPYPSDYSFEVDKIAITPKVDKMTATYHGHGAWATIIDINLPQL